MWVFLGGPLHELLHIQQEEEICLEAENACHLTTVHSDKINGCDHEFHLTQESNKCDLQALFQNTPEAEEITTLCSNDLFCSAHWQTINTTPAYSSDYTLRYTRGPPVNS